jgi:hypothetical protein
MRFEVPARCVDHRQKLREIDFTEVVLITSDAICGGILAIRVEHHPGQKLLPNRIGEIVAYDQLGLHAGNFSVEVLRVADHHLGRRAQRLNDGGHGFPIGQRLVGEQDPHTHHRVQPSLAVLL